MKIILIIIAYVGVLFLFWLIGFSCGKNHHREQVWKEVVSMTNWGAAREWLRSRGWGIHLYEFLHDKETPISVSATHLNLADITIRARGKDEYRAINSLIGKIKKFEKEKFNGGKT